MRRHVIFLALLAVVMAFDFLPGVVHFHQEEGHYSQQTGFKPEHKDRGYLKNCGPGGGYFNISWSPKAIDPTSQIKIYADIVSPIYFSRGHLKGHVNIEGNPMMSIDRDVVCEDLVGNVAQSLPYSGLKLKCPIKEGQKFEAHFVFPNTQRLIGYDGDYQLKTFLTNHKGEVLLCVQIDASVLPLPY